MTKISNKMLVASAVNRRRMEQGEDYPDSRKLPMHNDRYNYRNNNKVYETAYPPIDTVATPYYSGVDYPYEMRQYRGSDGRYMYTDIDKVMHDDVPSNMPMIGFDRDYERGMRRNTRMHKENGYNTYDGDIYASGSIMMKPYRDMDNDIVKPIDEITAMKWVKTMQHEDGTNGVKFKPEQAEQLREQICPECDQWSFFVAINMMHADYGGVAKKLGIDDSDFYAHMAKAFLCDKDAGRNKLRKYMAIIPK